MIVSPRERERTRQEISTYSRSLMLSTGVAELCANEATPKQEEFLHRVLREEIARRDRNRKTRLLSRAGFPVLKSFTDYEFSGIRFLPALVVATGAAFGFVYIHPFSDGNGRIHRYLLHHVLARKGFGARGMVFPVSSVFLARIEEYREVLQRWSHRLLPCIAQTIEEDLPRETAYLQAYDAFRRGMNEIVDMPERTITRLFRFLESNNAALPACRRRREFSDLTEAQLSEIVRLFTAVGL